MDVNEMLQQLPCLREGETFILGIDGLSRSGKTTVTKALEGELKNRSIPVVVYHIDDYIVEANKRYNTGYEPWYEYYFLQWDVAVLKEKLFKDLEKEKKLVILEGVFLQREEWRGYFNRMIYLKCSREERYLREEPETRKKVDKFKERYWKAEDYYLTMVDPEGRADVVIVSS